MSKLIERRVIDIHLVSITEKKFFAKVFNNHICERTMFIYYAEFTAIINAYNYDTLPHRFKELIINIDAYCLDDDDMIYFW